MRNPLHGLVTRWVSVLGLVLGVRAAAVLQPGFHREVVSGPELVEALDLTFSGDNAAWVTGRLGDVWRIDPVTRAHHHAGRLDVDATGDRGLHGIALHPGFGTNGAVFLFRNVPRDANAPNRYRSRISRFTVGGSSAHPRLENDSEQVLLEFTGEERGQHVGGALLVHPVENLLYVTTGDNNAIAELAQYSEDPLNRAQDPGDLRGKVLRIGLDGSIPADNPFLGKAGARPEVFTVGHRQPWQLHFDPVTRWILLAENGGDALDDHEEVNRLVPGANHGWPRVFADGLSTRERSVRIPGFAAPWFHYVRNQGGSCTGAVLYRGGTGTNGFPSRFRGGLFYADYNRKSVRFAPLDPESGTPGPSVPFAQNLPGGPVALREGPDGALYLIEYAGWFQSTPSDTLTRIVWKP